MPRVFLQMNLFRAAVQVTISVSRVSARVSLALANGCPAIMAGLGALANGLAAWQRPALAATPPDHLAGSCARLKLLDRWLAALWSFPLILHFILDG